VQSRIGAEHLELELAALEDEAGSGAEMGGRAVLAALVEAAGERRAALAELLPHGTPDDWAAAGSVYLFDEFERKAIERSAKMAARRRGAGRRLRRQFEALCVAGPEPFDLPAPALTSRCRRRPDRLHGDAAGADSSSATTSNIVPRDSDGAKVYEQGLTGVVALTFGRLMDEHLGDVDWEANRPRLDCRGPPRPCELGSPQVAQPALDVWPVEPRCGRPRSTEALWTRRAYS